MAWICAPFVSKDGETSSMRRGQWMVGHLNLRLAKAEAEAEAEAEVPVVMAEARAISSMLGLQMREPRQ